MLWSMAVELLATPGSLLAVAAVAAVLVVAIFAVRFTAPRKPLPVRALSARERARRAAAIRQREADASGRHRPRAPGSRGW